MSMRLLVAKKKTNFQLYKVLSVGDGPDLYLQMKIILLTLNNFVNKWNQKAKKTGSHFHPSYFRLGAGSLSEVAGHGAEPLYLDHWQEEDDMC